MILFEKDICKISKTSCAPSMSCVPPTGCAYVIATRLSSSQNFKKFGDGAEKALPSHCRTMMLCDSSLPRRIHERSPRADVTIGLVIGAPRRHACDFITN